MFWKIGVVRGAKWDIGVGEGQGRDWGLSGKARGGWENEDIAGVARGSMRVAGGDRCRANYKSYFIA